MPPEANIGQPHPKFNEETAWSPRLSDFAFRDSCLAGVPAPQRARRLAGIRKPDLVYTDGGVIGQIVRDPIAYYYNANMSWHQGDRQGVYTNKFQHPGGKPLAASDLRLTAKDRKLFLFCLGWPEKDIEVRGRRTSRANWPLPSRFW